MKWIKCGDGLPPDYMYVIVCEENPSTLVYAVARFACGRWLILNNDKTGWISDTRKPINVNKINWWLDVDEPPVEE